MEFLRLSETLSSSTERVRSKKVRFVVVSCFDYQSAEKTISLSVSVYIDDQHSRMYRFRH